MNKYEGNTVYIYSLDAASNGNMPMVAKFQSSLLSGPKDLIEHAVHGEDVWIGGEYVARIYYGRSGLDCMVKFRVEASPRVVIG